MMTQKQKTDIRILQALFTDMRFESLFNAIDRLHEVTNLSTDEVVGWLRDIVYTANETINELENPVATLVSWENLAETREDWSLHIDRKGRRA